MEDARQSSRHIDIMKITLFAWQHSKMILLSCHYGFRTESLPYIFQPNSIHTLLLLCATLLVGLLCGKSVSRSLNHSTLSKFAAPLFVLCVSRKTRTRRLLSACKLDRAGSGTAVFFGLALSFLFAIPCNLPYTFCVARNIEPGIF